jgi:hydroxymethylpyrimidine pyrophosphatase-like HAD family hydrolase
MVLPAGVDKASGMEAALGELALSSRDAVGVGDAENDLAFLSRCGCAVGVSNALAHVKERADLVTDGARGAGVAELIGRLLSTVI